MQPTQYRFTRYLAAKKSVDDRALNRRVWDALAQAVQPLISDKPLQVLEVGAGIGTMVERMVEWGLFEQPAGQFVAEAPPAPMRATITILDDQPDNIKEARRRLAAWADQRGFRVTESQSELRLQRPGLELTLELRTGELFEFAAAKRGRRQWDLLIAQAILDLLPAAGALPALFSLLSPAGLWYFSITFDGATILQPEIDRAFDDQVEALYHQTADNRVSNGRPSGDSRTGRHLFHRLRSAGASVLEMGSSDWVVFPGPDGYPADEEYFLHFIVHTIETALQGQPGLDAPRFERWIDERHRQIARHELLYIAHQLDILGQVPSAEC